MSGLWKVISVDTYCYLDIYAAIFSTFIIYTLLLFNSKLAKLFEVYGD